MSTNEPKQSADPPTYQAITAAVAELTRRLCEFGTRQWVADTVNEYMRDLASGAWKLPDVADRTVTRAEFRADPSATIRAAATGPVVVVDEAWIPSVTVGGTAEPDPRYLCDRYGDPGCRRSPTTEADLFTPAERAAQGMPTAAPEQPQCQYCEEPATKCGQLLCAAHYADPGAPSSSKEAPSRAGQGERGVLIRVMAALGNPQRGIEACVADAFTIIDEALPGTAWTVDGTALPASPNREAEAEPFGGGCGCDATPSRCGSQPCPRPCHSTAARAIAAHDVRLAFERDAAVRELMAAPTAALDRLRALAVTLVPGFEDEGQYANGARTVAMKMGVAIDRELAAIPKADSKGELK